ncbi:MAG: type toxin-antitoxin system PemK/MazF family toxin [Caulobacteraceae bacterium]|nr:type toxin-antitoxin system PemK/MazF family toxin [Caulobacteraceae bacterium]
MLVSFPFTNQTSLKQRPAVVVSSSVYNVERPDVVLMPITSQLRPAPALGEAWISDWRAAGLLKPSAVKPLLATLEQSLIIRRLGALTMSDQKHLFAALHAILG